MTQDQVRKVCQHINSANYGSFASALACTYLLADSDNRQKLINAFDDLFKRIEGDMLAYNDFMSQKA